MPARRYTDDQIARAKAMLLTAKTEPRLAAGEIERIAAATGLSHRNVRNLATGAVYASVPPAAPVPEKEHPR